MAEQPALSFAGLLRQVRREAKLTQDELAEAARLSPRSVSDLERGISRTARKQTALLLADALGLTAPERAVFVAVARGLVPSAQFLAARNRAPEPVSLSNLPTQLTTFIGRAKELAELRALMESCRLITLTGAGGSGKTRLALQVAADLLRRPADGVWLVELAPLGDGAAVTSAIARALRHAPQPGLAVRETLLDALASQDSLILLDNCEHLIGACAKTAEAILGRCPRVQLLTTSREPLGISGETIYRVPSLSLPGPDDLGAAAAATSCDSVALLLDRAKSQGVPVDADDETAPLLVSLCRRLDGMPLAIELAAARLRSMSLTELGDRLNERFRLLTGGSRTALERQQTLRAAIGWSYELLTGAERQLLGRLSVFSDGFSLGAAEAVCGSGRIDAQEVAGLLGSLVDKSLVVGEPVAGTMRYRLLETIRLFAAEQLAEAGEAEAVAAAHCMHFLAVAETAAAELTGRFQGVWLTRLDADRANLLRAGGHAANYPDGTALVLRLGVALHRYWTVRSRQADAFSLLAPVLRRPNSRADPALFASALVTAAWAAAFIDITSARQYAEEAVRVARGLRDDRLLIVSLAALCGAYFFGGEPQTGQPFGQESVARARDLGDDVFLGESLFFYLLTLDSAGSGQLMSEAIRCTERSGDLLLNASLHNSAAMASISAGDLLAARTHLQAAAQAQQEIGQESAGVPANMGMVLRAEGDLDGARSAFVGALRMSRRNGDNLGMSGACLGLACLAADTGDWHRAATLHGVAQAFQDRSSNPWQEFDARYRGDSIAQVRAHLGDHEFERVYAQGMALGPDGAIGLALGMVGSAELLAPA